MLPFTDEMQACLSQIGGAVDNPLVVVDNKGIAHVLNRAARELLGITAETPTPVDQAGSWRRELLDLLSRLGSETSATEVYLAGPVPLVLEGHALQRDGTLWGGLVVGRSGLGAQAATVSPGDLAQQIKSILHSVLLNLYVVRKWAVSHPFVETQTLARFDAIAAEVQRLDSVAGSFAMQPGQLHVGKDPIHLAQLFEEIVTTLTPRASDARIQIKWWIPGDLPPVRGDFRLLKEAFLALLESRLRRRPGDTIEIMAGSGPDHAFVMCRDSSSELAAAADPSAEPAGGGPETRRGLAVAEWIVRGHGGTLETFTTPGMGTTFMVRLPLQDPGSPDSSAEPVS
jgi:signal transduction histidine kinase